MAVRLGLKNADLNLNFIIKNTELKPGPPNFCRMTPMSQMHGILTAEKPSPTEYMN